VIPLGSTSRPSAVDVACRRAAKARGVLRYPGNKARTQRRIRRLYAMISPNDSLLGQGVLTPQRAVRFALGQIVATSNALAAIRPDEIAAGLKRHESGDWGEICGEDQQANDRALLEGERLFSAYRATNGTKFWIITEADRSVTTILLPEDY